MAHSKRPMQTGGLMEAKESLNRAPQQAERSAPFTKAARLCPSAAVPWLGNHVRASTFVGFVDELI